MDDKAPRTERRRGRGVRAGLRRHGLSPRPLAIRELIREQGLRFTAGNRVTLFRSGRPALESMLTAIGSAEHYVHLETYILRSDQTGWRFAEALIGRAREGVAVRVLYDAVGSLGIGPEIVGRMRDAGADVVAFNPVGRLYPRWLPRRRDHRKILSVDGRLAFAGGLNIGDEYWGGELEGERWRDTHLCIEGPAVRDLGAVFLESWFRADGPGLGWQELLEATPAPVGDVRCAVVPDGPAYHRRRMRELLIEGLGSAEDEVYLASPYLAPGRRVLRVLSESGRRVRVHLVLAGKTDHPVLRRAAHALLPRLLSAGVGVYEYEAAIMHAKVALFDRRWSIVGSSNLDRQSFDHSYEVNLVLDGGDVADRIRAMFEDDLQNSRRVDHAALASRGPWSRFIDRVSALVLPII